MSAKKEEKFLKYNLMILLIIVDIINELFHGHFSWIFFYENPQIDRNFLSLIFSFSCELYKKLL